MASGDDAPKPDTRDAPGSPPAAQPASSRTLILSVGVAAMLAIALWAALRPSSPTPPSSPPGPARAAPPQPSAPFDASAPLPSPEPTTASSDVPFVQPTPPSALRPGDPPPPDRGSFTAGGPAVLALFGPVREGTTFSGAEVLRISAVTDGRIYVLLRKEGATHQFVVSLSPPSTNPAAPSSRYAVTTFGSTEPPPAALELAAALAQALRPNAPTPPGLRVIDWAAPTPHPP